MKKTIEAFLNEEVKDYSISVIKERAIPSVIDGFKPVQRKIIFTADKVARGFKGTKALVGAVMDVGGYGKGDMSVEEAIVKLVQDFPGANNVPWLDGDGTFGSRFVPKGAAAARYTKTRISQNFSEFFRDDNLHTFTNSTNDENTFEPDYYIPVIPTILLNGPQGIAVGFDCEFQPYNKTDIIKAIRRILDGKPAENLRPYFKGFRGRIEKADDEWVMYGCVEKVNSTTFRITEIPAGVAYSREKYIEYLNKLMDRGIIKDFVDKCSKAGFDFVVTTTREAALEIQARSHDVFKLKRNLKERLNAITEFNTLKQFNNANEIIEYFVNFRLLILTKRRIGAIMDSRARIDYLEDKIKFIQCCLDGKIKLQGLKNREALLNQISKQEIKFGVDLVKISMYRITKEELKQTKAEVKQLIERIKFYETITEKELYLQDLNELKE